jgi:hypothetical protein
MDLVSVDFLTSTPESTGPIFWWLIGGDERKVPFDDHLFRTNAWVDWSDFFLVHWGRNWMKVLFDYRCGSHLGFGFHQLSDERLSIGPIFWCLIGSSIFTMFHFSLD